MAASIDTSDNVVHQKDLDGQARKEKGLIGFDGKDNEWCPYTETSQNYDTCRKPLGVGISLGSFATSAKKLSDQKFLDVGCGTGTFIATVHGQFEHITGLEYNDGMVSQAKAQLKALEKISLLQGSADNIPFDSDSFDAVTMNQVVHHFPQEDNFVFLKRAFGSIFNVVKPGGSFVLNHFSHEQCSKGYWWGGVIPKAVEQVCARAPPLDLCVQYMREVGFEVDENEIATPLQGTLISKHMYLEKYGLEGAFVKEYLDGDSTWAMAESIGELAVAQAKIRQMQKEGTADAWLAEREAIRKGVGQATFITARKPAGECAKRRCVREEVAQNGA